MNFQRILLKIAYWLVALSIVVLIGLTFYARHVITGQSQKTTEKPAVNDESTKIEFSGMSLTIDNEKAKEDVAEMKEAMKKEETGKTGQD